MAATISANSAGGGGLVTSGDASGVLALQTAGVTGLSIDASQNVTFANSLTSPTLTSPVIAGTPSGVGTLTSATAVASTSGTSIDFTGIPSWAKRINVLLKGVSLSGSSGILVQIGSGSVTTSGYLSSGTRTGATSATILSTSGVPIYLAGASEAASAAVTINLVNTNNYICNYSGANNAGSTSIFGGGEVSLSGTLDRVRITTVNGTDTFDAGSINIMYE